MAFFDKRDRRPRLRLDRSNHAVGRCGNQCGVKLGRADLQLALHLQSVKLVNLIAPRFSRRSAIRRSTVGKSLAGVCALIVEQLRLVVPELHSRCVPRFDLVEADRNARCAFAAASTSRVVRPQGQQNALAGQLDTQSFTVHRDPHSLLTADRYIVTRQGRKAIDRQPVPPRRTF